MKQSLALLSAGIATAAAQTSYLTWFADSFIRKGVAIDYGYVQATLYLGYEAAYEVTKNETLLEWYQSQVDGVVLDNGTIADWDYSFHSLDEYVGD
jgi:hypothetical protein